VPGVSSKAKSYLLILDNDAMSLALIHKPNVGRRLAVYKTHRNKTKYKTRNATQFAVLFHRYIDIILNVDVGIVEVRMINEE